MGLRILVASSGKLLGDNSQLLTTLLRFHRIKQTYPIGTLPRAEHDLLIERHRVQGNPPKEASHHNPFVSQNAHIL
jgi:hypothetical protein